MRPNIIFYFSDQQRYDTLTEELMPNLWQLGLEGVTFDNSYTCQPVCGPARACLQSGVYATENGCFRNGISLPREHKTLADYFNESGYDTAYIGKWHLASDTVGFSCEKTAVPKERQGGYRYWRAADVLEFTSDSLGGYVFDEEGNKISFEGYRSDCINGFATEYIRNRKDEKPFFMFVSQLEPHHQNSSGHFEGPKETVEKYRAYPIPEDLSFLKGNYKKEYPDYIAAISRLDKNVGELVSVLKEKGLYDNTVIIYTSDHGCHFKTRNAEYKRSCHDASIHTPLVFGGGAISKKDTVKSLASLIDLPPTLLSLAGIPVPPHFSGRVLPVNRDDTAERDCVFIQISESHIGRAVRTKEWKYSAKAFGVGVMKSGAVHYFDDYLYYLKNDPYEKNNLVSNRAYADTLKSMRELLSREMVNAGEKKPVFHKALRVRKY